VEGGGLLSRRFLPVVAGTILILTLFFAAAVAAQETTGETTDTTADPATTDATADATADAALEDGTANREGSFRCDSFLRVVRDENGALRGQYRDGRGDDEQIVQLFEQCLEGDILANTIPNRLLPDTGGAPLLGLAAIGLATLVAGASVLGAVTRRRR
jgi:LPXTG-motif cell wall-anchored protein